jgi:hypothetical protein
LSTCESRQEYINKLYGTITNSIKKAEKRTSLKEVSAQEFLDYFKRYMIEGQSIKNSVVSSKSPVENIQVPNDQNTEATLFSYDVENVKSVINSKSIEEISAPTFTSTAQSSQLMPITTIFYNTARLSLQTRKS